MQNLDWIQVLVIFSLGILNAVLIGLFSSSQSKIALIATLRSIVQLLLLGLVLEFAFGYDSWLMKIFIIALIIFNASFTLKKRINNNIDSLWAYFIIMLISIIPSIILVIALLDYEYYAKPFFLIPFVGMLVGNSLTGLTLGINGFYDDIKKSKKVIFTNLSFNMSQYIACKSYIKNSMQTGLTPILNSMLIVGIVSIPGLMTGQMISGVSPFLSARYQFFIIIAIETTVIMCLLLYYCWVAVKMTNNDMLLVELLNEDY
jgi:putative ABC transport system permease protein